MAAAQEAQKKLNHKLKFKEPFFGQQMEKALQHNGVIGLAKPLTLSWLQTTKDLKMSAPGGAELCTFCRIRLHSSKLLFFSTRGINRSHLRRGRACTPSISHKMLITAGHGRISERVRPHMILTFQL